VTPAMARSQLPTLKNVQLGYVVIDGTKALIGYTGTVCVPGKTPSCFTNNDPANLFNSGKSFATLWSEAQSSASNVYSPNPVVQINGSWYAYTPGSSGS